MKGKNRPFVALGIALGIVAALVCAALLLLGIRGCSLGSETVDVETWTGFDEWDPDWSHLDGSLDRLIHKDFLTEYPYADGDYRVERRGTINILKGSFYRKRSLVWLTYDDPAVYEAAKQSRFDAATSVKLYSFEDPDVYGFTFFYIGDNATFPANVSVFGHNDEKQTLVFVGATRDQWEKEDPHVVSGLSDFAGFLDWFYGDWFDWTAGDRAPD